MASDSLKRKSRIMLFIVILFSETLYGRFKAFNPDLWQRAA